MFLKLLAVKILVTDKDSENDCDEELEYVVTESTSI